MRKVDLLKVGLLSGLALLLFLAAFLTLRLPDEHTTGVPGCTGESHRTVTVPSGVTVAFSCPTHIEVTSMDEHRETVITIKRGRFTIN